MADRESSNQDFEVEPQCTVDARPSHADPGEVDKTYIRTQKGFLRFCSYISQASIAKLMSGSKVISLDLLSRKQLKSWVTRIPNRGMSLQSCQLTSQLQLLE